MALIIKLTRNKKKKKPFYKIIVVEKNKHKKAVDFIGFFDPIGFFQQKGNNKFLAINIKKIKYWLSKGANIKGKIAENIINFLKENEKKEEINN